MSSIGTVLALLQHTLVMNQHLYSPLICGTFSTVRLKSALVGSVVYSGLSWPIYAKFYLSIAIAYVYTQIIKYIRIALKSLTCIWICNFYRFCGIGVILWNHEIWLGISSALNFFLLTMSFTYILTIFKLKIAFDIIALLQIHKIPLFL